MTLAVRVEGLKELDRAFGRMSKDLRKELRKELAEVGKVVADEAQNVATTKGLVRTGKLVRSIKPSVRGGSVFVRETAKARDGFRYPRRYEFQDGGRRAFLKPALEHKTDEAVERLDDVLGRLAGANGFD